MIDIIGVRFKKAGKIYYFNPCDLKIDKNKKVIVETARGIEFGNVVISNRLVDESEVIQPLKKVLRIATEEDVEKNKANILEAKEAISVCDEKAKKHGLEMKLIDCEYTFEKNKIIFYFTAEGRIDFRMLVRDLASIFKTRIELRQIGVRDEAKMLNGIGICGRELCCASWKPTFDSVSIKQAKDQSLSLNPTKISGVCGRLMCCINYEHETYKELLKNLPQSNTQVETPDGIGLVIKTNTLKQIAKVRLIMENNKLSDDLFEYNVSDIKQIKKGKIRNNKE
jgi:cell fate regulator YaaT (PSP1 superfamily)